MQTIHFNSITVHKVSSETLAKMGGGARSRRNQLRKPGKIFGVVAAALVISPRFTSRPRFRLWTEIGVQGLFSAD